MSDERKRTVGDWIVGSAALALIVLVGLAVLLAVGWLLWVVAGTVGVALLTLVGAVAILVLADTAWKRIRG